MKTISQHLNLKRYSLRYCYRTFWIYRSKNTANEDISIFSTSWRSVTFLEFSRSICSLLDFVKEGPKCGSTTADTESSRPSSFLSVVFTWRHFLTSLQWQRGVYVFASQRCVYVTPSRFGSAASLLRASLRRQRCVTSAVLQRCNPAALFGAEASLYKGPNEHTREDNKTYEE